MRQIYDHHDEADKDYHMILDFFGLQRWYDRLSSETSTEEVKAYSLWTPDRDRVSLKRDRKQVAGFAC